jgi:dihydrofolate synthase/folylpolyglutamate synthase
MLVGMVNDKDIDGVLALMPKDAVYYFTQASIARALSAEVFAEKACRHGLKGNTYPNVAEALRSALQDASEEDFIFIGGSTFIVADAYPLLERGESPDKGHSMA